MKATVDTQGLSEALEALAQMGANLDQAVAQGLSAGGKVLETGMVNRAPELTGNLKSKIQCSAPTQDGNYTYVEIGLQDADAETARYGNVQEYGSADTPAHPYVRPTVDADMGRARKALLDSVKAGL